MARRWRNRWLELSERELPVIERLQDEERGAPATFSMEQVVELFASPVPNQAVTEDRSATGQKQSWRMRWSSRVSKAFPRHVGRLTWRGSNQTTPDPLLVDTPDEEFDAKVSNITQLYNSAVSGSNKENAQYVSMKWREFRLKNVQKRPTSATWESSKNRIWHPSWNTDLIANFNVATGQIIAPTCGDTRTESDFAAHICTTIKNDPDASKWDFIVDCLNTHQSESLVRLVVELGLEIDLGIKGESSILNSMQTRAAFLSDLHTVLFSYTPLHSSWLNQIEIWFSILCVSYLDVPVLAVDLKTRILDFIDYFNRTMAKPFKWTYKGKLLLRNGTSISAVL